MVPLGIGISGSVQVGRSIGAGDPSGARRVAMAVLLCGVGFMGLSATAFALLPRAIARAYTNDLPTIALAAQLIPIAAVFQVFDGLQCVSIGLLRGTGDTRTPMIVNLVGYWAIGLPMSLWLGRTLHGGPVGLWWGFVAGLVAVSIAVAARLYWRFRGPLERLVVEGSPAGSH
jgi:MATE family multidrug resistance protein